MKIIIVVLLLLIAGYFFLKFKMHPRKITLRMQNHIEINYEKQGYIEFSANYDTPWLSSFFHTLEKNYQIFISQQNKDNLINISKKNESEKNVQTQNTVEITMKHKDREIITPVLIEWDNSIGNIIRIYAKEPELHEIIRKAWNETTEKLGV
jgi:hypothetical protein